jgi:hypothetical protein
MTRDMGLVRQILFAVERDPHGFAPDEIKIEGYTEEEIGYHSLLLIEAGLLEGEETTAMGHRSPNACVTRLTWAGHEFLDAARNDNTWTLAKGVTGEGWWRHVPGVAQGPL